MGKHYASPRAVCPYYLHESHQLIYCDGIQEGNVLHLAFSSAIDCKDYKNARCCADYQKCKVFRMLEGQK